MARRPLKAANIAYIVLTIMALQFMGLVLLIVGQLLTGNLASRDLLAMLFVLRGTHKYVKSDKEYERYQEYLKEEEAYWQQLETIKGPPPARRRAAEALEERREIQEENATVLQRMLEQERAENKALRASIESEKQELARLQKAIDEARERRTTETLNDKRQKLEKTLANMDEAQLAGYFSNLLRPNPEMGAREAARVMHAYMKGDRIAAVMEEMVAEDRQKILPVLEYKYAGWAAEKIAQAWARENLGAESMALYLKQMPTEKAFRILPYLDPDTKGKVVRLLQSSDR